MFQNWFIFLEHEDTYACPWGCGHTPCWGGWGVLLSTTGPRGPRGLRRGGARGLKGRARTQRATARARARGNGKTRESGARSQTGAEVKGWIGEWWGLPIELKMFKNTFYLIEHFIVFVDSILRPIICEKNF